MVVCVYELQTDGNYFYKIAIKGVFRGTGGHARPNGHNNGYYG